MRTLYITWSQNSIFPKFYCNLCPVFKTKIWYDSKEIPLGFSPLFLAFLLWKVFKIGDNLIMLVHKRVVRKMLTSCSRRNGKGSILHGMISCHIDDMSHDAKELWADKLNSFPLQLEESSTCHVAAFMWFLNGGKNQKNFLLHLGCPNMKGWGVVNVGSSYLETKGLSWGTICVCADGASLMISTQKILCLLF